MQIEQVAHAGNTLLQGQICHENLDEQTPCSASRL